MIEYTKLKKYAARLYAESELCSEEEHVAEFILTSLEHAHNVESVLMILKRDMMHQRLDQEDTTVLEKAAKYIEGSK
jgi:hypothetical protein